MKKNQSCIEAYYRSAAQCDNCAVACLEESYVSKMTDMCTYGFRLC
jgi:hypothetical protein